MMKVGLALVVSALALGGCASANPEAIGPYPSDPDQLVRDQIRQSFFDPYSIRDAGTSTPQQGHLFFQQGWVVCLQANAKNRMGGYVGLKRVAFLINNNKIVNTMADAPLCNGLSYYPLKGVGGQ